MKDQVNSAIDGGGGHPNAELTTRKKRLRQQWDNIPNDILELIRGRVCPEDRSRMRAVCKAWSLVVPVVATNLRILPSIMRYGDGGYGRFFEAHCYDLDTPYQGFEVNQSTSLIHQKKWFSRMQNLMRKGTVHAAKQGWVLLSLFDWRKDDTMFYTFSPFTDHLHFCSWPALHLFPTIGSCVATFSIASDDDCVILAALKGQISTCSRRDMIWRTTKIIHGQPVDAFYDTKTGCFCVGMSNGELGSFDVSTRKWRALSPPLSSAVRAKGELSRRLFFVAADDGNFLVVDKELRVWSVDNTKPEDPRWLQRDSLGNRVLFLSAGRCFTVQLCDGFEDPLLRKKPTKSIADHILLLPSIVGERIKCVPVNPREREEVRVRGIPIYNETVGRRNGIWFRPLPWCSCCQQDTGDVALKVQKLIQTM